MFHPVKEESAKGVADAVTLANRERETAVYCWQPKARDLFDYPHGPNSLPNPPGANIQWVNLNSSGVCDLTSQSFVIFLL